MARKTLLYLCAHQLHAWQWRNHTLSSGQLFSDDAQGRERFCSFIKSRRDPMYLLADLSEEDFRIETVPHAQGSEHSALVQRKLEQLYRDTPFCRAERLQRLADGRRDDQMLFSALTDQATLTPWLTIMQTQHALLTGIHSVATISSALAKGSDHLLLLSWQKYAGLRQSYFNAGHLHFSRLTPIDSEAALGKSMATEAIRTRQYLHSMGLPPQSQEMKLCIICHAQDQPELESHLSNNADARYTLLDIVELARRLGLKTDCKDSDATPLFLHLLATKPPRSQYANTAHTLHFRLRRVRQTLAASGATLLALCLWWCAADLREGIRINDESHLLGEQAASLQRQAQHITAKLPNATASAAEMKTAVLLLRQLDRYSAPPQDLLTDLSAVLDDYPRIRLDKLSWQASTVKDLLVQVIALDGELEAPSGDDRDVPDYLERFRQALTLRGYEVQAQTLPPGTIRFSLQLRRKKTA